MAGNADEVIVLDNGHVLERGTHQDLLRTQGAYKKLVESQLLHRNSESQTNVGTP